MSGFVRVSGYSQSDLDNKFTEGYNVGYTAGYNDGKSTMYTTRLDGYVEHGETADDVDVYYTCPVNGLLVIAAGLKVGGNHKSSSVYVNENLFMDCEDDGDELWGLCQSIYVNAGALVRLHCTTGEARGFAEGHVRIMLLSNAPSGVVINDDYTRPLVFRD